MPRRAIVLDPRDNVATALVELGPGDEVELSIAPEGLVVVSIVDPIPFGHKFALADVASGEVIVKYGEIIGRSTAAIRRGAHVHVHNVASIRGSCRPPADGR